MPLWSSHPRVFLDIAETGEAMCPYCGTRYGSKADRCTATALTETRGPATR